MIMPTMALLPRLVAREEDDSELNDTSFKFIVETNGREFEKSKS